LKLIAQMNSFQNCCLFFGFTKIWFFIIPLPSEEQQLQQLPSSCFDKWDDRWRCPANQVRLCLTIWFKHIKCLTISIYQDVFVQIGTVRTGKSDMYRDWWKQNVYFGHQEFSYCLFVCLFVSRLMTGRKCRILPSRPNLWCDFCWYRIDLVDEIQICTRETSSGQMVK